MLIVGASLAGVHAAEELRAAGYDGRVCMVGAEDHPPYDRPPLSKEVLAGVGQADDTSLRDTYHYEHLDIELLLGCAARELDLASRTVTLENGEIPAFDALIVATGAAPRMLKGVNESLEGLHMLRTLDDCLALREALATGARLVVVGGGFIGLEVAAAARTRGLDVTVLEALRQPMSRVLGDTIGRAFAELHVDHGVDVRSGSKVAGFEGCKRVEAVRLADGSSISADVVVIGVGAVPSTAWLEGSSIALGDGVLCNQFCRTNSPTVYAAGDVARWWNPLFREQMRVEHWTNAAEQAKVAARNLLAGSGATAYAPVPFFWSDQYDTRIQLTGHCGGTDEMAIVHGSLRDRCFVALYGREQKLRAALGFNSPRELVAYRRLLGEGASWEAALALASERN